MTLDKNAGGPAFTYGYTADSNLIAGLTETTGSNFAQTRSYLANRNLLDIVETKVSTASKAKFDYAHDALGRRANVVQSGEMFSRYLNGGLHTAYGYNDRSELISAQTYNGQNPADNTSPLSGRNYGYAYDNIGNRTSTSVDGSGPSYTTNNLNQYTQTTRYPGYTVTGLAPAAATVTVNGATATRQGEFFHHWVGAGAASTSVWWNLNIASSYGGAETRNQWLPASPQAYTYDLDGNLLTDDRWAYEWDAENRLKAMQTRTDIISGALIPTDKARRIEFTYDYLGRRVEKVVKKDWNGSSFPTVESRQRFIYYGWNLIAEYDALSGFSLSRSYTWGLDLSGSIQGAGGVGGLLAIIHASGTVHLPAYDGNGNLLALVNRSTGAIEAAYEYSPFGETIRATGSYATVNPFRFSTKYTDNETGLVYYGFRFYSPTLGRFVNRDPIEEQGGLNLYAFVQNNSVNNIDVLGLACQQVLIGHWIIRGAWFDQYGNRLTPWVVVGIIPVYSQVCTPDEKPPVDPPTITTTTTNTTTDRSISTTDTTITTTDTTITTTTTTTTDTTTNTTTNTTTTTTTNTTTTTIPKYRGLDRDLFNDARNAPNNAAGSTTPGVITYPGMDLDAGLPLDEPVVVIQVPTDLDNGVALRRMPDPFGIHRGIAALGRILDDPTDTDALGELIVSGMSLPGIGGMRIRPPISSAVVKNAVTTVSRVRQFAEANPGAFVRRLKQMSRGKPLSHAEAQEAINIARQRGIPIRINPRGLTGAEATAIGPHIHIGGQHVRVEPGFIPH